jgi:hypothetical protein
LDTIYGTPTAALRRGEADESTVVVPAVPGDHAGLPEPIHYLRL